MNEQEMKSLWNKWREIILATTSNDTEKAKTDRYFALVGGVEKNGAVLKVKLSSEMAKEFFEKHISDKLRLAFQLTGNSDIAIINYEVGESPESFSQSPQAPKPQPVARPAETVNVSTLPLNPQYTFEEFVSGPSNSWAFKAAQGVVASPGAKEHNPLFIHGGTGLGKTHLMQAIGHALLESGKPIRLCYLSAETFMNEYMNAMAKHTIDNFRSKYRSMDVLLVDDVQFMASKLNLQEEFFNTFNALQNAGKQIVMTSDVPPKNLPELEPRLLSRFEGGLMQAIDAPRFETRLAILRKKAENYQNPIPEVALQFIAENIKSHVRAMEGALSKIKIMVDNNPEFAGHLTREMLNLQLMDLVEKERKIKAITCEEIIESVRNKYGISLTQMLSSERTQELVTPRQVAMFISYYFTTLGASGIAPKFNKTHATILSGVKRIKNRLDVEPKLKSDIDEILSSLGLTSKDIISDNQ